MTGKLTQLGNKIVKKMHDSPQQHLGDVLAWVRRIRGGLEEGVGSLKLDLVREKHHLKWRTKEFQHEVRRQNETNLKELEEMQEACK